MQRWTPLRSLALLLAVLAATPALAARSRCSRRLSTLSCRRHTTTLWTGWLGVDPREVHWQVPVGAPPAEGWPVVLLFQPSVWSAEFAWTSRTWYPAGAYYQTRTIQVLLDAGYAVLTPEAGLGGTTFWDTNVPLYSEHWETAPDHAFMLDILDGIEAGTFGDLDPARMFAVGMSSGGYMTSRMAVSYAGRFTALAVQSGSYATCAGPVCCIPELPVDHPPTLFVHGWLDPLVPRWTMDVYADALDADGVPTRRFIDPWAGHQFIQGSPGEILEWFQLWDR